MEKLRNFGDERQTYFCVFCGGRTETRDHVPSRVFLDEPYPTNLPVVPACHACNSSFSMDEEYFACLLECVKVGSVDTNIIQREKIKRILERKPALTARLSRARGKVDGNIVFKIEVERVQNVLEKLARGHAAFELNEPQLTEPSYISFFPLQELTQEDMNRFEVPPQTVFWPEVGSRAMQRMEFTSVGNVGGIPWTVVQPEQYRFLTSIGNGALIRIVIGEYLGCEARWS